MPNIGRFRQMEKEAHRYFNPQDYPKRSGRFDKKYFLLSGPAGVGKSWTVTVLWSILANSYNQGTEKNVVFLYSEGTALETGIVGSKPKNLRELRAQAQRAVEQGKLPVCFYQRGREPPTEPEKSRVCRWTQAPHFPPARRLLAMLWGPAEMPGMFIVDINTEKTLDQATLQRFCCISFPQIDRRLSLMKCSEAPL